MKRGLFLLLAVCTLAAAMVPRERRAVNTEEDEERLRKESAGNTQRVCAPRTPCKWVIYNSNSDIGGIVISNTYCVCNEGKECSFTERDTNSNSDVYRCRAPGELTDDDASENS